MINQASQPNTQFSSPQNAQNMNQFVHHNQHLQNKKSFQNSSSTPPQQKLREGGLIVNDFVGHMNTSGGPPQNNQQLAQMYSQPARHQQHQYQKNIPPIAGLCPKQVIDFQSYNNIEQPKIDDGGINQQQQFIIQQQQHQAQIVAQPNSSSNFIENKNNSQGIFFRKKIRKKR